MKLVNDKAECRAKEPILTRNFACTFLAQFFISLVMYTLITTIGEYVTAAGATAMIAGMASGIYVFGGLISRICSGQLLNRYGWKSIAVIFLAIHFAASCCYFFADSIVLLIIVRFIHGIGFGAAANSIMVIGMASLPKSRYGEATGYFMLSTSLGIAIGPFVGGLVYDSFGGTGSFAAASLLAFLSMVCMCFADMKTVKNSIKVKESGAEREMPNENSIMYRVLEPKAIPTSLCILFMSFGYAAMISFYRLYAVSENMTKEFSFFFVIYAVVLVISRPTAGKLQDRFGDAAVCYPSFVLQTVGLLLLALKPCMVTVVICAAAGALGYGTMNSCLNAIVNRNITNDRRPFAATTFWACCDMGVGIGPMLLGAIITASGYHVMYVVAAGLSFLAVPMFFAATKWSKSN